MTNLYVRTAPRSYRVASRTDVAHWMEAHVAATVPGRLLASPVDAADFVRDALRPSPSEVFAAVYLNNRHRVISFEIAFRGTIDNTTVYVRELVRRALEVNAAAAIVAHNHPSLVAEPSDADRIITRRIRDAFELVDVRLLDHLVVGGDDVVSMAARGLM